MLMKKVFYEAPGIEIIPMTYLEHVCQNPSNRGNAPDYTVVDYEWEDEV